MNETRTFDTRTQTHTEEYPRNNVGENILTIGRSCVCERTHARTHASAEIGPKLRARLSFASFYDFGIISEEQKL